jgi:hypothetical protein
VADTIFRRPGGTLPHEPRSPADLKAPYRLMGQDAVTHAAVLAPHRRLTRRALGERPGVAPIVQDFTEPDYTGPSPWSGSF